MMPKNEICRQIRELIPAYSLGALDPEDEALVGRHLDACPGCLEELEQYDQLGVAMLHAVPPQQPPAGLKEQVLANLPAERPLPEKPSLFARPNLGWVAVAMAAAVLILNVVLLFEIRAVRTQRAELQSLVDRTQVGLAVLTYPTSQVVEVEGEGEVFGTFVFDPQREVAVLYAWGLEMLPADSTYQAWFTDAAGNRVNGGLFDAEGRGGFTIVPLWASEPVGSFDRLGVTVEPSGGSQGPSGPPVLTADL